MGRIGVISITKTTIQHIVNFILSAALIVFLYDHSLLKALNEDYYKYAMFSIGFVVVVLLNRHEKKRNNLLLIVMIITCFLSILFYFEYYNVSDVLLVFSILMFYSVNRFFFDDFTIASIVCFLPFLYIYVRNVVFWHYTPHNHGAVHIAICGFLLISYLYRKGKGFKTLFICSAVLFVSCVTFGSRTSLLSAVAFVFILYIFYLQQEKGNRRSLIFGVVVTCTIMIFVFLYYEKIYAYIFLKWGTAGLTNTGSVTIQRLQSSSRMRMWSEVFKNISLFGYGPKFVNNTFGYQNIHNNYIQGYVQYGIVFAVLYCILVIKTLIRSIKNCDTLEDRSYTLLLVPMIIFGFLESNFILDPEYQYLGLVFLLVLSQVNTIQSSNMDEGVISNGE